jgi:AcrR family transcriptional regulator
MSRGDSETTKQAILEAARERFAGEGHERATIRAIAADAGIDPALVMRYFGNKVGVDHQTVHVEEDRLQRHTPMLTAQAK